jgi:putative toxin-antitoxin system antitoxin component (TIGR02293 family)
MNYVNPGSGRIPDFTVGLDRVDKLRELGFSDDELYTLVAPRRTLARRRENGELLSPVESDRVQRLERIWAHGVRVFANPEKFARWLRSEIIALDGARPIDLLASETGAQIVDEELGRIDYGMLA